jgi:hypothetical protein
MYGEAKKLHLIEAILKIENDAILEEVESVITRNKLQVAGRKSFKNFAGIWTSAEADEITRIIEESCEQINPDDWK